MLWDVHPLKSLPTYDQTVDGRPVDVSVQPADIQNLVGLFHHALRVLAFSMFPQMSSIYDLQNLRTSPPPQINSLSTLDIKISLKKKNWLKKLTGFCKQEERLKKAYLTPEIIRQSAVKMEKQKGFQQMTNAKV